MKKFQFLLLDAGPVLKLFELGIWEKFIEFCDVTLTESVVQQCIYYEIDGVKNYIDFPFEIAAKQGRIKIADVNSADAKEAIDKLNKLNYDIHTGEQETISFFLHSTENFQICAADGAVFKFLGFIGKGEMGISLEELLKKIGLTRQLEWRYSERFRTIFTKMGQQDKFQNT